MNQHDQSKPYIVIGAGIGGLSAALSLKARGLPVVLLEKHSHAGGKMRTVDVAGKAIDAGPTVFTMRWVFEALFARAGLKLDEHVKLHEAHLLARHSWLDQSQLDLYPQLEASMEAITAFSGAKDADNYRHFANQTEAVFNTLDHSFMRAQKPNPVALGLTGGLKGMIDMANTKPFISLWNHLAKSFHDPRLRQLFARYATYCGSSPFKAPATLMLIAHVERAGVSLVEGGMKALANAIADVLEKSGTDMRYGEGVAELMISQNTINGVVLESGETISAQAVIFNGDTQALATGLLGSSATRACSVRSEASLSAVTRCQVAKTSGFPLAHHTVFFGDDYEDEFDQIFNREGMTNKPTVYICAQDRGNENSTNLPLEHERLFSLVNAPASTMNREQTEVALQKMDDCLAAQGLVISDDLDTPVVTGPSEFSALFPATDGALYGQPTHGWMGSFNRPGANSRIKGLYLCGGSVHPGAGVPMTSLSGQLAADKLCKDLNLR